VARLMQIQCHGYMIYSNCNMNEWIRMSAFSTITNS
jgi:hypothetical protein